MSEFLPGILTAGYLVVAAFFFRFWQRSRDRLFLIFAIAFLLLGVNRTLMSLESTRDEIATPYYWIRLAAFLLILGAIIDKNLRARRT